MKVYDTIYSRINNYMCNKDVTLQEEKSQRRSRTAPHYGIPFRPQLQHKITDPEPFTFDERDRERASKKTQKIEQVYDEEKMVRKKKDKGHHQLNMAEIMLAINT